MPKVDVFNMKGEVVGNLDLNDSIFGIVPNETVLHEVVVNQLLVAEGSLGVKKVLGMLGRVLLGHHSGSTVELCLRLSLVTIAIQLTKKRED